MKNAILLYREGAAAEKTRDWKAAQTAYAQAVGLAPDQAAWHYRLGLMCELQQDWAGTIVSYQAAINKGLQLEALPGRLGKAYLQQGQIEASEGRDAQAQAAFASGLEILKQTIKAGDAVSNFGYAEALSLNGRTREALEFAVKMAASIGFSPRLARLITDLARTVCSDGFIAEGLESWKAVRSISGFEPLFYSNILQLAHSFGIFTDEIVEMARESLAQPQSLGAEKFALLILGYYDGASPALAERMTSCLDRHRDPALTGRALAMWFYLNELERLDAVHQAFPETEMDPVDSPALAAAFLRSNQNEQYPGQRQLARETLAAYESVSAMSQAIWSTLGNIERSLAIVGNSGCELGLGKGAEIDGHDMVVRFNHFVTTPPYDRDYGTKTTCVVRVSGEDPKFEVPDPAIDLAISALGLLEKFDNWALIRRLLAQGHRVGAYPAEIQRELLRLLKRVPSNGIVMCWLASQARQGKGRTSFYGFSFVDQIGPKAISSHYFEIAKPGPRHDWPSEARLFESLTGRKPSPGSESTGP